jgi:hypothetical protein
MVDFPDLVCRLEDRFSAGLALFPFMIIGPFDERQELALLH